METEITCDWIDRYNDDELSETEKAIFQKRMSSNPLLRSEVYIDACLNRLLADEEVMDLMCKIRTAARKNAGSFKYMDAMLIAASVLCFAMIGGLFYLYRTNLAPSFMCSMPKEDQVYQPNVNEPVKNLYSYGSEHRGDDSSMPFIRATHESLMAKNFKPLSEFELLIGSVTRSYQFKLISPNVNDTIYTGTDVLFAWQACDHTAPITIIMMNNHGIPVSEISLNHACSFTLKTNGCLEGLYYWKIMMDDEMVLMGKLTMYKSLKSER